MGRPAGRPVSARVSPHGFGPVQARPFKPIFKMGKNEGTRSALGSASARFARGPGPRFTSLMKEKTDRNRDKPNEANKEYEDHLTAIYPLFHSNFDWKIMLRIFFKK